MNILFYFDRQINPERGGTERVTDLLAHYFLKLGHLVYYLAKFPVEVKSDIDTYFLPEINGLNSNNNIEFVENFVLKNKIDFIINQGANGNDIYIFNHSALNIKAKIITVLHFSIHEGLNHFVHLFPKTYSFFKPWKSITTIGRLIKAPYNKHKAYQNKRKRYEFMYNYSDIVVVLSPGYLNDFALVAGLKNTDKLVAIANPNTYIDMSDTDLTKKEKEILFVGRLSYAEKRVDRLLKVWSLIQDRFPDWSVNIVGDGDDRERLESLSVMLDLDRVKFHGYSDPKPFYKRASIFCITSNHEGLPMVLIEAMQHGVVPMAYNSFSAAPFIINNQENGFLVSPFNLPNYAKKISELMENENLRKEMGDKAMKAVEKYNPEFILTNWSNLFDKLLNQI